MTPLPPPTVIRRGLYNLVRFDLTGCYWPVSDDDLRQAATLVDRGRPAWRVERRNVGWRGERDAEVMMRK